MTPTPPTWFTNNQEDYKRLTELDSSGWVWILDNVRRFRFFVPQASGAVDAWLYLNGGTESGFVLLQEALENAARMKSYPWSFHEEFEAKIPFQAFRDITNPSTVPTSPRDGLCTIEVNLNAPDGVLLRRFEKWLEQKRKNMPTAVRRRGRNSARTALIDKQQFAVWTKNRILEMAQFDCWYRLMGTRPDRAEVCYWLFPDDDDDYEDPAERLKRSRKTLKNALDLLPLLRLQSDAELGYHTDQ